MNEPSINSIIKTFTDIFPEETSFAIADSAEFIYYQPSRMINLNIKPGDAIRKGSATDKALSLKQKVFTYIDSNVFGMSYYGLSVPLFNHSDELEGCVTAIFPVQTTYSPIPILTIKTKDRWIPVHNNDIYYLEAENRKAKVVAKDATGYHKYNLSDIEYLLPANTFIRCHRSFIVNINEISEIQPDFHSTFLLIMKNGDRIPVSQSYASYFRKMLIF